MRILIISLALLVSACAQNASNNDTSLSSLTCHTLAQAPMWLVYEIGQVEADLSTITDCGVVCEYAVDQYGDTYTNCAHRN